VSEQTRWSIAGVAFVLMGLGLVWMLCHPMALRDESDCNPKPYSYARAQLWLWTAVILPAWVVVWAQRGVFWPLNETCLALLGISGSTAAAARMIDHRDASDPGVVRHQDAARSKGFFEDILSDEKGVSIHRFQSLVFNLAYALAFLLETFEPARKAFPSFDGSTLALLGVSTATYVMIKATENVKSSAAAARTPAVSDELVDPGGYDEAQPER
jgi:hypothetical protein